MHPNSRAELHEVRHRRGFIMADPISEPAGAPINNRGVVPIPGDWQAQYPDNIPGVDIRLGLGDRFVCSYSEVRVIYHWVEGMEENLNAPLMILQP